MIQYLQILLNARRDEERGASAVEYGLLVSLIALAIIVAVGLLGTELDALFDRVTAGL
ncbi:Flp family type IVb pilin [Nocardioides antri]|uniref:Flp family type IVb pilin n=1 Tax=Nocardioides antri TaxID=2607659 RepID=A0A5B1M919_9ACTN|nr:Flp family type IVb pilin [Nocardioides antri]KAA1428946.1 Flp family type IVb pilin [Nocardioides antri]